MVAAVCATLCTEVVLNSSPVGSLSVLAFGLGSAVEEWVGALVNVLTHSAASFPVTLAALAPVAALGVDTNLS